MIIEYEDEQHGLDQIIVEVQSGLLVGSTTYRTAYIASFFKDGEQMSIIPTIFHPFVLDGQLAYSETHPAFRQYDSYFRNLIEIGWGHYVSSNNIAMHNYRVCTPIPPWYQQRMHEMELCRQLQRSNEERFIRELRLAELAEMERQVAAPAAQIAPTATTNANYIPTMSGDRAAAEPSTTRAWHRTSGYNEKRNVYPVAINRRANRIDVDRYRQDVLAGINPHNMIEEHNDVPQVDAQSRTSSITHVVPNPLAKSFKPAARTITTNPVIESSDEAPFGLTVAGRKRCNPRLYKTRPCRNWEQTGTCEYMGICKYAHGSDEMRLVPQHPHWKTKACVAYREGRCAFGDECYYLRKSTPVIESVKLLMLTM